MHCPSCIQKRIEKLSSLIKKHPGSIVGLLWKKELDSLRNKKDLFKNKYNCCKKD